MIKISIARRYALVALVLATAAGLFWFDFGRRYIVVLFFCRKFQFFLKKFIGTGHENFFAF